jgi:GPH family glycoside/pentoside/hexuronide:cation symporter
MTSYITDFYISVLQAPLVFVLLLVLLTRVFDAFLNPVMGIIADKFNSKRGKMKPYILFTAIPIGILTFFMYFNPRFGHVETMVFTAVIFVSWTVIYTVADVPFWTLPQLMTGDPQERGSVISVARTLNGIGGAIPMGLFLILGFLLPVITPNLVGVELNELIYMVIAAVGAILGTALYMLTYFFVKERVGQKDKREEIRDKRNGININNTNTIHDSRYTIHEKNSTLKRIFTCKPLMLVLLLGLLASGRYLMQVAAVHVARYAFYVGPDIASLADEAARTAAIASSVSIVATIFTVCSAIGIFGSMLLMPFLYKKFNYRQIIVVTSIAGFIASLLTGAMGLLNILGGFTWAVYLCIPFIIIQCIPIGAINVTSFAMIGDSLDYMEWKTGFRDNALGSACQNFVNKIGSALATALVILMYIAISLSPADIYADQAVVFATDLLSNQRIAMFALVSIVPGISLLLCTIPMFWYDLTGKKKEQITKELAERRAQSC